MGIEIKITESNVFYTREYINPETKQYNPERRKTMTKEKVTQQQVMCFFHYFSDRCKNPGIYGNPSYPIGKEYPSLDRGIRTMCWCKKHKHDGDILLVT